MRRKEEEVRRYANGIQGRRDKTPEGAIYGEGEPSVTGGSGYDELLGGIQGQMSQDEGTVAVRTERARGSSVDITVCFQPEKHDTGPLRHLSRSSVPGVVQSGSQSSYERDQ